MKGDLGRANNNFLIIKMQVLQIKKRLIKKERNMEK
jgi:hypothetical protein